MKYISYLRVSTQKQGQEGYGVAAQRETVDRFIKPEDTLIKEYVEVESGTKGSDKQRPVLAEALRECRLHGYTLVVARIDRLYRNVYFTAKLMESNVNFVCCDMPLADKMTIQLLAVLAEWEAEQISKRTKLAMAEVKKYGSKSGLPLGCYPGTKTIGQYGLYARYDRDRNNPINRIAFAYIAELKKQHLSSEVIARKLNQAGYTTAGETNFRGKTVNYIYRLFTSADIEKKIALGPKIMAEAIAENRTDRGRDRALARIKDRII